MRRSKYRRASNPTWFSGRRRIIAVAATLAAFGGIVTVTQISSASTSTNTKSALAACDNLKAGGQTKLSTQTRRGTYTTNNGAVTQHPDDGAGDVATTEQVRARCRDWVMKNVANAENQTNRRRNRGNGGNNNNTGGNNNGGAATSAPASAPATGEASEGASAPASGEPTEGQNNGGNNNGGNNNGGNTGGNNNGGNNNGGNTGGNNNGGGDNGGNNGGGDNNNGGNNNGGATAAPTAPPPGAGLGILTNSCDTSNLPRHDGFQKGDRCVSTEFGEVGSAANNPSLLITQAPRVINRNQAFTLQVSTRNLIRDRFLAAGQGGYYVESSVLQNGLVRGHFHTACRMLASTNEAPTPEGVPAFFVATEDSKGGRTPDSVTIQVPGLPQSGTAQCASWAGDGSHRIPMMERANQTPAFDVVRIRVR